MEHSVQISRTSFFFGVGGLAVGFLMLFASLGYLMEFYLPSQKEEILGQLQATVLASQANAQTVTTSLEKQLHTLASLEKEKTSANLSAIIKQWSPMVPQVSCRSVNENGYVSSTEWGSGMVVKTSANELEIWTNKHVISSTDNCEVLFLDGSTYTVSADKFSVDMRTDFGSLTLQNPTTNLLHEASRSTISNSFCKKEASAGDEIVVLGYPSIGSNRGITATEGIISGIEDMYYVTSAKVEHGNSGGIAISVKNNCYLGIPTFVKSGTLESLARILPWQAYDTI